MGDLGGLITTMKEAGLDKQAPELLKKMTEGVFTLRDMYSQFQNIMNMGSLSNVMSMIPGLSENLIPKGKEKEGAERLKRFCCTYIDDIAVASPEGIRFKIVHHTLRDWSLP